MARLLRLILLGLLLSFSVFNHIEAKTFNDGLPGQSGISNSPEFNHNKVPCGAQGPDPVKNIQKIRKLSDNPGKPAIRESPAASGINGLPALPAGHPGFPAERGLPAAPGMNGHPASPAGHPGLPALPAGHPGLPALPAGHPGLPAERGLPVAPGMNGLPALPAGHPGLPALPAGHPGLPAERGLPAAPGMNGLPALPAGPPGLPAEHGLPAAPGMNGRSASPGAMNLDGVEEFLVEGALEKKRRNETLKAVFSVVGNGHLIEEKNSLNEVCSRPGQSDGNLLGACTVVARVGGVGGHGLNSALGIAGASGFKDAIGNVDGSSFIFAQ